MTLTIRRATREDAALVTAIEAACFPPAEAAGIDRMTPRLARFADHFWIAEEDGLPVGMINGMVIDQKVIDDVMYADASLHRPDGRWQSVFGIGVIPAYRGRGYAAALMKRLIAQAREEGRSGVVLTCKDHMIAFYEQFGYRSMGVSASEHGGAKWSDMILEFEGVGQ